MQRRTRLLGEDVDGVAGIHIVAQPDPWINDRVAASESAVKKFSQLLHLRSPVVSSSGTGCDVFENTKPRRRPSNFFTVDERLTQGSELGKSQDLSLAFRGSALLVLDFLPPPI
jgi:hypothetical protein